jgi:hypothetical protein
MVVLRDQFRTISASCFLTVQNITSQQTQRGDLTTPVKQLETV